MNAAGSGSALEVETITRALIVMPIAISAADELDVSAKPVLIGFSGGGGSS